jgi:hypothetical protein
MVPVRNGGSFYQVGLLIVWMKSNINFTQEAASLGTLSTALTAASRHQ